MERITMKKLFLLCYIYITTSLSVHAQDIEVKKFEPMAKDQTAVLSPRKDINGVTCGLVKVQLKEPGAEFEGNVMGDVQFTGSEYLVYLPNGTKRLGIKHPDYLPTTIVFADYGIKRIASSTTYELKLKTNKKKAKIDNSKMGMAVFNIKPSNAMLLVDGQIADGSGGAYTLSLPYGTHYYTVKLKDFSINNQSVQIDKNAKNINVDLTDFFAKVDVSCKTEDAEILINDEQKGVGKWDGMMIPGKYTIEAQKDGCHSQTRQIELKDNDTIKVDFSALKTITGSLQVDYEPAGADILLNGKKVGVTPLVLKELPVGEYQLEIWKECYVKEVATVKIAEDQEWKESGNMKLTQFGEIYFAAQDDFAEDWELERLADYYRYGAACGYKGDAIICDDDPYSPPYNPVMSIPIYKKINSDLLEGKESYNFTKQSDLEKLSFLIAKESCEGDDISWKYWHDEFRPAEQIPLAWHYFYGIGCEKNVEYAKQLMRWSCRENGTYSRRAFTQLIKEMGLDSELIFVTRQEYYNQVKDE